MNDHNLDDLIIDSPDQKGGKAKGLLTIIALFIVVLIVAIILTKIILKDPNDHQALLDENETEMISPELTLQEAVDDEEEKKEDPLSYLIKSEMDAPKEPKRSEESVEEVAHETVTVEEERPAEKPVKEEPAPPAPKKEIVKTPKEVSQPKAQPKPKPAPVQASNEQYYIQVGSFSKIPSASRLVNALKRQHFNYTVMDINHMHKVMVGPYKSRAEADRAIVRVKSLINKNAFVVKK